MTEIPDALIEAAARAEYAVDAAAEESDDFEPIEWDQALARVKDYYLARAAAALAAAPAECEVDEQHDHTRDGSTRTWHRHVCPDTTRRRLVITTPASPVDTPREEPRS